MSITEWEPEDASFWAARGRKIANRNMWLSVFTEHIGFCVWSLWSVLVLFMTPKTGFAMSAGAVIAVAGTFGGLGGVAINLAFRQSYASAHNARPALTGFLIFYAVCLAVTLYARRRATVAIPASAEPVTV